jgi:spore germination cell wall hydrolase CwlJ-like protein
MLENNYNRRSVKQEEYSSPQIVVTNVLNRHTKFLLIITSLLLSFTILYTAPSVSDNIVSTVIQREVGTSFNKQLACLTKNIYYESASEPYEGKLAVAQVTINRANSGMFPKDICDVVYQKTLYNNSITCQFSWTCLSNAISPNKYQWEESEMVARKALTQPVIHDTLAKTNALYYHADYVNPGWNKSKVITKIGRHIFYAKTT